MTDRIYDTEDEHRHAPEPLPENNIENRIDQIFAATTAQRFMIEALVHAICFEIADISRTRLLNILDVVHQELEAGLGCRNETARAFGEQRDSLRSLLISGVIEEESALARDQKS